MIVAGLQKFSLIDYPGKTSAIIFTRGCNFRCRYCHNPELVIPEKYAAEMELGSIYDFLQTRQGKLDAVVITGGEPTIQADLVEILRTIKGMGFLVKLDTNGTRPETLENVIKERLVDYLAMDIKAPFSEYAKITGVVPEIDKIKKSIELIKNSGLDHEFRTTVLKSLLSPEDLLNIAQTIKGAQNYVLQKFVSNKTVDPKIASEKSYSVEELQVLAQQCLTYVKHCYVR